MAKRRNKRSTAMKKIKLPKAAQAVGFTAAEEAFFATGDSDQFRVDTGVYAVPPRPSFWRRLLARASLAV